MEKIKRSGTAGNTSKELELTPGEKLMIWRRRQGWNQATAAEHFGISIFALKLAEYDKKGDIAKFRDIPFTLRNYEKCVIYRKRSGKTQPEIGVLIGIGREWLRMQELGEVSCNKLLAWWENDSTKN